MQLIKGMLAEVIDCRRTTLKLPAHF